MGDIIWDIWHFMAYFIRPPRPAPRIFVYGMAATQAARNGVLLFGDPRAPVLGGP